MRIMLGRGIIGNPCLAENVTTGVEPSKERLCVFHQYLLDGYRRIMSGDRNVLFKMKELWNYILPNFNDYEKPLKQIRKAEKLSQYEIVVKNIFAENGIDFR